MGNEFYLIEELTIGNYSDEIKPLDHKPRYRPETGSGKDVRRRDPRVRTNPKRWPQHEFRAWK